MSENKNKNNYGKDMKNEVFRAVMAERMKSVDTTLADIRDFIKTFPDKCDERFIKVESGLKEFRELYLKERGKLIFYALAVTFLFNIITWAISTFVIK